MFHFIPPENIWFSKVFKGYRNRKKEFSLDIEFELAYANATDVNQIIK